MWGGSIRAERVAVDVGRECESWGGAVGSWVGSGGPAVGVGREGES